MNRAVRALAMIAPVLGLGALWAESDRTYNTGTDWDVPIMGYDPRDYLRGHYVEFSYDWPGLEERSLSERPAALCIAGQAPAITRVTALKPGEPCAHPLRPADGGVYGLDGLRDGRLYIGQDRATQLQEQLQNRDQRGIVTIRQREDGSFTPVSIRFRPLTPAEIAERDAPPDERFDPLGPPAVMGQ